MNTFIPFSLPHLGQEEIDEVVDTLKSSWLTTGPKVEKFEFNFENFIGKDVKAISVNSATSGLHLALEALGISKGDEVIVPSLTFTSTAEVVRYLGADVVIVDVDPMTLNINIDKIKSAITSKTKAIIPVHFAGLSCEMNDILLLAKEFNLKVVEDAAHALPSCYKGNKIGSLNSDATVFSFYANKTITTGEGGMVVTRHLDISNRIKIMRLHGIDRDIYNRFQSKKPSWNYNVVAPGFKYNMTDIAASIGIHQLKKLPDFLIKRKHLADRYFDAFSDLPIITPPNVKLGGVHAWHLFVIRLKDNANLSRDAFIQILSEKGIGTSVHYKPLHRQPYWRKRYNLKDVDFPAADSAFKSMVSIPLYSAMTFKQQDYIIESIIEIFND